MTTAQFPVAARSGAAVTAAVVILSAAASTVPTKEPCPTARMLALCAKQRAALAAPRPVAAD